MHGIKFLGQHVSARDPDRPDAEFQVRVAALSGFTSLGAPMMQGKKGPSGGRGGPVRIGYAQQSRFNVKT
jgi:hypothetical protein